MANDADRVGDAPEPTPDRVGDGNQPASGTPFKVFQTEDDWRKAEEVRTQEARKAKREADQLRAELEKTRKANETEQDKAIREAREQAKAEALAEARSESIAALLEARGYKPEAAAKLAVVGATFEGNAAAVIAAMEADGLLMKNGKPVSPGGDGPARTDKGEGEWTDDRIDAVIRSGQYAKYRDQIEKARLEKVRRSGMLTP